MIKMSDIGEKSFIASITSLLKRDKSFINGFGHDASIIDIGLDDYLLAFKIDRAAKPLASFNGWTDFKTWGRLAVTANISDIVTVGAQPKGFMISVTVPRYWKSEDVKDIILGAQEECTNNNISFLGGDTKEGKEANIVGSAFGIIRRNKYSNRHSSNDGDYIVLAGELGGFSAGYLLLKNEFDKYKSVCLKALSHPKSYVNESMHIYQNFKVNSAVDLSDGLWEAINLLLKREHKADIFLESLPMHENAAMASNILDVHIERFAFSVGDWGIVFSMPKADAIQALESAPSDLKLSIIGEISKGEGIFTVNNNGTRTKIANELSNEHFRSTMETEGEYFNKIIEKDSL